MKIHGLTTSLHVQASELGSSLADRLRINAVQALRGMSFIRKGQGNDNTTAYIGDMQSRATRMRIQAYIWAMRAGFWISHALQSGWDNLWAVLSWLIPFRI